MGDDEEDAGLEVEGDYADEELAEPMDGAEADERADLQKLVQQHPEIWIPYEDQVKERLRVTGPGDPYHTTYPFLTEYELTKLLSLRAREIDNGAHPYVEVPEGVTSSYEIAQRELAEKKLPYILKRPLPNGEYEYWSLLDLMILKEE